MPDERHRDAHDDDDELPPPAPGAGNPKLQRWVDLLAALLSRGMPATFEELARSVPEYLVKLDAADAEADEKRRSTLLQSLKRTFERDKDELRAFGVPIESLPDEDGNAGGMYRLRAKDFYLPYLCCAVPGASSAAPRKVDRYGYRALTSLTFDADELQAVVDAAACVRALGDPLLASNVESALRKLAVDLPVDASAASADEPVVVLPRTRADAAVFEALSDALVRRKVATFTYRAMSSDRTEVREVEPYGLFFVNGHWYLAARDRARGEMRNFRLNRMADVAVNPRRPQTADFDVSADFRLREHARSRQAWELGDGDATPAVVAFRGASGPTVAAMKLGRPVEGHDDQRAFDVRRPEAFVRWVLSFAGELVPVAPDDIVDRYREELEAIARLYEGDGALRTPSRARAARAKAAPPPPSAPKWEPKGAAAQLRRVLHVVPQVADGSEQSLGAMAEGLGVEPDVLRRDLFSLTNRFDVPGGFVEGVQLYIEQDRVTATSSHLRRPMRLTVSELCALELGLAVLQARRPPDEQVVLERARGRLRAVIAQLPDDAIPDGLYGADVGEAGATAYFAAVRTALRERRKLRLVYRRSGRETPDERVVHPHALLAYSGVLYFAAHCEWKEAPRFFRLDRVEGAEVLEQAFELPADFSLDAIHRDGSVFDGQHRETMLVRYSPRVARWVAERAGMEIDDDGGLVVEHPLADPEWGVRHVLQYGAEAEVLAPAAMRERVRERLASMVESAGSAVASGEG